jgi:hypothetical protein
MGSEEQPIKVIVKMIYRVCALCALAPTLCHLEPVWPSPSYRLLAGPKIAGLSDLSKNNAEVSAKRLD